MPRTARALTNSQRLDRVIDHVAENFEGDLSLARLARIAGCSPFHFHRLFQAYTGETVHGHVRRVRVERAASLMRATPSRPLTDIALEVGFGELSELSRAFKAQFGMAPSRWDRKQALAASVQEAGTSHARMNDAELAERARGLVVRTTALPRSLFVYERVFDPYGSQRLVDAYHRVRRFLDDIGVAPAAAVFAGMSLDDPAVVPAKQCRYDMGLLFPFEVTGVMAAIAKLRHAALQTSPPSPAVVEHAGLSVRRLPALDVASLHIEGDMSAMDVAWQWLFRTYLPRQRRAPANAPAMELFVSLPEEIGWEWFHLFAVVPLA